MKQSFSPDQAIAEKASCPQDFSHKAMTEIFGASTILSDLYLQSTTAAVGSLLPASFNKNWRVLSFLPSCCPFPVNISSVYAVPSVVVVAVTLMVSTWQKGFAEAANHGSESGTRFRALAFRRLACWRSWGSSSTVVPGTAPVPSGAGPPRASFFFRSSLFLRYFGSSSTSAAVFIVLVSFLLRIFDGVALASA